MNVYQLGFLCACLSSLLLINVQCLETPGVRILKYLHARGESMWITLPQVCSQAHFVFLRLGTRGDQTYCRLQPVKGVYLLDGYTGGVDQTVISAVAQGYNMILISFLTTAGLAGACRDWQLLNSSARSTAVEYAHSNGAVLLLSVGGANDMPYDSDPVYYGQRAAWWANELSLDGVDFDLENVEVGAWQRSSAVPAACGASALLFFHLARFQVRRLVEHAARRLARQIICGHSSCPGRGQLRRDHLAHAAGAMKKYNVAL